MADFSEYHIQYVTLAPHPDRNSLDDLFRLLDGLEVFERDRMLVWMYLAFLEAPSNGKRQRERKKGLNSVTTSLRRSSVSRHRRFQPFLVHAVPDLYPGLSSGVW